MSDTTTHLLLPYILAAQAQKHPCQPDETAVNGPASS